VPAPGSGWAVAEAPSGPPQGSILVTLSGILLIVIGLLVGLIGVAVLVIGAIARRIFDDAVANGTLAGTSADVVDFLRGILIVLGLIIGLYGLGQLIAGLGVLMKRQWGRILGILLAILPALLFTLALPGAAGRDTAGGLIVVLVLAVANWFIIVALATGGRAFRHG